MLGYYETMTKTVTIDLAKFVGLISLLIILEVLILSTKLGGLFR